MYYFYRDNVVLRTAVHCAHSAVWGVFIDGLQMQTYITHINRGNKLFPPHMPIN